MSFIGAHEGARKLAKKLVNMGGQVMMLDVNRSNIRSAHESDLPARHANVLSDGLLDDLELSGIGRAVAMTANDEVNTLSAARFGEMLGVREVYQLSPPSKNEIGVAKSEPLPRDLRGRYLFDEALSFWTLEDELSQRNSLDVETISVEMSIAEYRAEHMERVPLFVLRNEDTVLPISVEDPLTLKPEDQLLTVRLRSETRPKKRTTTKRATKK